MLQGVELSSPEKIDSLLTQLSELRLALIGSLERFSKAPTMGIIEGGGA